MLSLSNNLDDGIAKRFTRLYIAALTAVAFLTILGQFSIQSTLNKQTSDSWIINYAGRQRFKSQQIVKETLLLTATSIEIDKTKSLARLKELTEYWEKYHNEIRSGNIKDIGIQVNNSDSVQKLFALIDPHFDKILRNVKNVIRYVENGSTGDDQQVKQCVKEVLFHEQIFLNYMDEVVFQYDREAKAKVNTLKIIEFVLVSITLLVLTLEGFFVFRPAVGKLRHSIEQLILAEKNAAKMNAQLADQKIREQKLTAASLIEGQEEERKRLARELHDGLGQMLTALKFGIEGFGSSVKLSEKGKESLENLKNTVVQTIQETRSISFNLMPSVLNDFGIASALKLLVTQTANSTGKNILFDSSLNGQRFHKSIEVGLYRIAQEGINNAVKYAQAEYIKVNLSCQKKSLTLTISDDGKGFSYESQEENESNGISNMRERSHLLNGEIKISSKVGKGTSIKIKIPLNAVHDKDLEITKK